MTKVSIALGLLFIVCSLNARFTSVDPAREFSNPYSYTANNPIIYIDPDGRAKIFAENPNHKAILEQVIGSLKGPLGQKLRTHDFIVTVLPYDFDERVLGLTDYHDRGVADIKKMSSEEKVALLRQFKPEELAAFIVIEIKPGLIDEGGNKLLTTIYHETSHGDDYLNALLSFLAQGAPYKSPTRLESETSAYKQGNLFIREYLNLDPSSPAGIKAGAILDIDKYVANGVVLKEPKKKIDAKLK